MNYKIPKHKKNSIENVLKNKGYEFGFLNLSNLYLKNKIWMYAIEIHKYKSKLWSKVFDGLIYTENSKVDIQREINLEKEFPYDSKKLYYLENVYQLGFKNAKLKDDNPNNIMLKPF